MDGGYPLNLIVAVATASATIFLGFLPTRDIRPAFFARQALTAAVAWVFVALASPPTIMHYHFGIAILCGGAWWKFRRDNAFSGKMWLSLASGLGISVGVMLILAVTPSAQPPGLPQLNETLLLASIYLGGAVIGLAYVCSVLTQNVNANSGVTYAVVQRHVGLLLGLTVARAAVLPGELFLPGSAANDREIGLDGVWNSHLPINFSVSTLHFNQVMLPPMLGLVILAFLAQRAARLSSRVLPTRFLVALVFLGFLAEMGARLLAL